MASPPPPLFALEGGPRRFRNRCTWNRKGIYTNDVDDLAANCVPRDEVPEVRLLHPDDLLPLLPLVPEEALEGSQQGGQKKVLQVFCGDLRKDYEVDSQ